MKMAAYSEQEEVSEKQSGGFFLLTTELLEDSSSSDSDEDDLSLTVATVNTGMSNTGRDQRNRFWNWKETVLNYTLDEFKGFFRVSRVTVQSILGHMSTICQEGNITGILDRASSGGVMQKPIQDRLIVLLYYMASQEKFSAIAYRFGMSESTCHTSVHNLMAFIAKCMLDKVVVWPSAEEALHIQHMFLELKGFPGVTGMIDGTHIEIPKPSNRGFDYYNRKDYYSIVLQAVAREDLRFIHVYTGWPGKVHDARVFRRSPLYEQGQNLCGQGHILGDLAYPNLPWLLTPFRDNGHLSPGQEKYNKVHASIRSTVERAFGLLKSRFNRLKYIAQKENQTIVNTILTACIFHNLCIMNDEGIDDYFDHQAALPQFVPNTYQFDASVQEVAAVKRLDIATNLP